MITKHPAELPLRLIISFPRRRPRAIIPVRDLVDASHAYQMARDESGEGASTWPSGRVVIGEKAYTVSYNGKVWDGETMIMEAQ